MPIIPQSQTFKNEWIKSTRNVQCAHMRISTSVQLSRVDRPLWDHHHNSAPETCWPAVRLSELTHAQDPQMNTQQRSCCCYSCHLTDWGPRGLSGGRKDHLTPRSIYWLQGLLGCSRHIHVWSCVDRQVLVKSATQEETSVCWTLYLFTFSEQVQPACPPWKPHVMTPQLRSLFKAKYKQGFFSENQLIVWFHSC